MRVAISALIVGTLVLSGSALRGPEQLSAKPAEPEWISDYGAAATTSRTSGKPLFVAFR